MAFSAGNKLLASELNALNDLATAAITEYGISAAAVTSGTDDTSSGTLVNMAGTGSTTAFSFTKIASSTRVRFDVRPGWRAITAAGWAEFAVLMNGVDYVVGRDVQLSIGDSQMASLFSYVSGVAAGIYTCQLRWRVASGTTIRRSTQEWVSASASEVQ